MNKFFLESFLPPQYKREKNDKRYDFIDLAKGICIILVVMAHANIPEIPNVNAMRMPLYFFLSGLFFKHYQWKIFISKKINNILIPFIFFLFIWSLWYIWHCKIEINWQLYNDFLDLPTWIKKVNIALWFLVVLFLANLIFFCLIHITSQKWIIGIVVITLILFDYFMNDVDYDIPFFKWFFMAIQGLPFFYLGFIIKRTNILNIKFGIKKNTIIGSSFLIISYLIFFLFDKPKVIISEHRYDGNPIWGYLNGITMILGLIQCCRIIKWVPIISYLGKYSIIVLCVHMPLIPYIGSNLERFFSYTASSTEIFLLDIIICWLVIPILIKIIPYLVAQKPILKYNEIPEKSVHKIFS